jgi:hypothetical protein
MFRKMMSLALIIVLLWAATLALNYFWRRATAVGPTAPTFWPDPSFFYTFTLFVLGLLSFIGFLSISRELRGERETFQDGDVRFALTSSFVTVFFALLSFFIFTRDQPSEFAQRFFDSFLNITVLIVGFYFATTGVIEVVGGRHNRTRPTPDEAEAEPVENRENRE